MVVLLPLMMALPPAAGGTDPVPAPPALTARGIEVQDAGVNLSEAQVKFLKQIIESLPREHLRGLKTIVIRAAVPNAPLPRLDREGVLTIEVSTSTKADSLCLPVVRGIALNVYRKVLSDDERGAFLQSRKKSGESPSSAESVFEVYYMNYVIGSDSSLLTATDGEFPENVFPILFVASQFTDRDSGRTWMSLLYPGQAGVDSLEVSRTQEALKVARFTFYLEDGAVVGSSAVPDGGRPSLPRGVMQLKVERTRRAVPVPIPEVVLSRFKRTD
jgi:hypothetical protein